MQSRLKLPFARALLAVLPGCAGLQAAPALPSEVAGCQPVSSNWLEDVKPVQPADYAALYGHYGPAVMKLGERGTPCSGASDPVACRASLPVEQHRAKAEPLFRGSSPSFPSRGKAPFGKTYTLVVTRGDTVTTDVPLRSFLGDIDTPGEAALMVRTRYGEVQCAGHDGAVHQVQIRRRVKDCPVTHALLTLAVDGRGDITELSRTEVEKSSMCIGRRPAGLVEPPSAAGVPDFLAGAARLEATSVLAFQRLAEALRRHGAPSDLIQRCLEAAEDEVRHAVSVTALAEAFGARVPPALVASTAPPTLLVLAVDNAVEGCVRETYGALVGAYQALVARDPRVAAAMTEIAADEQRHAELAWAIAAWVSPRLTPEERAEVRERQAEAVADLRREAAAPTSAEMQHTLGWPPPEHGVQMVAVLEAEIWA